MIKRRARVIAFYLPQYHPTPENDKYWGKGFTEWTNVTKAKPLFKGHYQPKLPADLGYYDLRLPIIREQQAQLAKEVGIEGFMYWHYWFGNGVMTLQDIFEDVLATGKPDFPFCLGWANHEWSNKTWTKGKQFQKDTVIFEMKYPGEKDWIAHFNYCLPAFKDKRYITVDGKPLFYLWQPFRMPDMVEFMASWQEYAHKADLPGIHFVSLWWGEGALQESSLSYYFDKGFSALNTAFLTYAEDNALGSVARKKIRGMLNRLTGGEVGIKKFDYERICSYLSLEVDENENVYPTILSGYDRTARSGKSATVYDNYTPETFSKHIAQVLDRVKNKPFEHRIVFLKSWNEWAEGNYVEPDLKYGHGYLDALKDNLIYKDE
ncbi:MAG: glycoside hydrolase family 99-like domain-containing protein [Paludibacteraceae bacterium]|nr:glycoside hydrolase family 99-like domain-containing protein [Paludibacteraceae bacterium]